MRKVIILLTVFFFYSFAYSQRIRSVVNGYGHMSYNLLHNFKTNNDPTKSFFALGEHDLFVNSYFKDRISFLGEFIVKYTKGTPTTFSASIDRARLKFDYYKNHSVMVGKLYTPINYWNDVYNHGRVFFPSIDRPTAFSYIIPLHSIGLQLQGQNLGKLNFGYDVMIGNGMSASDVYDENLTPATTVSLHIKPIENFRIGASYFYDYLKDASITGAHTGHSIAPSHIHGDIYKGELDYHLVSSSISYFGDKYEFLNEFSYNGTKSDSVGLANNFANYTYVGYRINEKNTPYVIFDLFKIAEKDLYTYHYDIMKFHVGYRYEFNELLNLKAQLCYARNLTSDHNNISNLEFKVQFSYGF